MKRYLSIIVSMVIFLNFSVFSAHTEVNEEVRPLYVLEASADKIASVRVEFDVLGIVQKFSPVPTLSSSNLKLKKSGKEQVDLGKRLTSVLIKDQILKALSKIDSDKISKLIASTFELDAESREKISKFIKSNLELTPSQLDKAFLGVDFVLNYNGTDILVHTGFENIGSYLMENVLGGTMSEDKKG